MVYETFIIGTLDGKLRARIECESGRFTRNAGIQNPGAGTFTLDVRAPENVSIAGEVMMLTEGWANTVVVLHGDTAVYAGPIVGRSLDYATGKITVRTREVTQMAALRTLCQVGARANRRFQGRSARGTLIESLQAAFVRTVPGSTSTQWTVPFRLTASESGPHDDQYLARDLRTASDWISTLQERDGWPEVDIAPVWNPLTDSLIWSGDVGSPRLERSTLDVTAGWPDSRVVDVRIDHDWTAQKTGAFAIGAGTGETILIGEAGLPTLRPDMPFLDSVVMRRDVREQNELNAAALAALLDARFGVGEVAMKLRPDEWLNAATIQPYTRLKVEVAESPMKAAHLIDSRVLGLDGDLSTPELTLHMEGYRP